MQKITFLVTPSPLEQSELLSVSPGTRAELIVETVGLLNHTKSEFLIQALVIVSEDVGGFAIRHFVVPEPMENLLELTREYSLDIFNVIYLSGLGVISTNGNNFPVNFTVINHSINTERLYLVDATHLADSAADLDNIYGIVVTLQERKKNVGKRRQKSNF